MKRWLALFSIFALGCTTPEPGPGEPVQQPPKPGPGWTQAPLRAELPAPREELLELGFPHELPEIPRALMTETQPWTSGRAMAFYKGHLYIADTENGHLVVMNATTGLKTAQIPVGSRPEQVVVAPDGNVFVSVSHSGQVVKLIDNVIVATANVGVEPRGLALSPDAQYLFVVVRSTHELLMLSSGSLEELDRVATLQRPNSVAVSPEGFVVVGGQSDMLERFGVGDGALLPAANKPLRTANPADEMLHFGRSERVQANRVRGAVVMPESGNVLLTHQQTLTGSEMDIALTLLPDEFNEEFGGEGNSGYGAGTDIFSDAPHLLRPMVGAVTVATSSGLVNTAEPTWPVRDELTHEPMIARLAQPSDINHHPTHTLALVTGFGSDNVLVLNTAAKDPMRSPVGIIEVGMAPKAVTFSADGLLAYVLNAQSYTVSRIDMTPFINMKPSDRVAEPIQSAAIEAMAKMNVLMVPFNNDVDHAEPLRVTHQQVAPFGNDPLPGNEQLGRRVFTYVFNAKINHGGTFACHSCHYEGGEDSLVWFVPGGIRQTPQLGGRLQGTGPFNWLGTETGLQSNMEQTILRMGGEGLDNTELGSLERYLTGDALVRPPNPNRRPDGLSEQQARGRDLFFDAEVGCATCHVAGDQSDGKLHDVGTTNPQERNAFQLLMEVGADLSGFPITDDFALRFNTPTLRDLFATAPYLHDGTAKSLYDVLDKTGKTMGKTSQLSGQQKDDLIQYLLTL